MNNEFSIKKCGSEGMNIGLRAKTLPPGVCSTNERVGGVGVTFSERLDGFRATRRKYAKR